MGGHLRGRWGRLITGVVGSFVLCFFLLRVFAAIVYEVHYIKKRETWESIAQRYGVSVQILKEANKEVTELRPGEILVIPRTPLPKELSSENPPPEMKASKVFVNPGRDRPLPKATNSSSSQPQIIGELGLVVTAPAPIRLQPSPTAPMVYTCSKGQQLIINSKQGEWLGVMMANGSTCWIHSKYVQLTGFQLVRKLSVARGGNPLGQRIVAEAMRYLGCPYKYGGSDPITGLDCSALVQLVFRSMGVNLPRTAAEQFKVGFPVPVGQLQPGDRLYFSRSRTKVDHTGIYIGGGQFIHATRRFKKVVISSLYDPRYWSIFVGAKR